jgi:hypothetical protein
MAVTEPFSVFWHFRLQTGGLVEDRKEAGGLKNLLENFMDKPFRHELKNYYF